MKTTQADIIIIGAGAAGLTCAHELLQQGHNILMLEARPRIGGRIFTLKDPFDRTPLELGAEFIHGKSAELMQLSESLCMNFYDVMDQHLIFKNFKTQKRTEFWSKIETVMKKLEPSRKTDRSVSDFLNSRRLPSELREQFASFVEGYHAADAKLMSEKSLADSEESNAAMFRFSSGYSELMNGIFKTFSADHDSIRLNTAVKSINWDGDKIEIKADCLSGHIQFHCKMLVVTLPLGVLKSFAGSNAAIEWLPKQPEPLHEAISGMQMGEVHKLIFRFHNRFWEKLSHEPYNFIHLGPENYFPTWWNLLPLRSPHLVAWQGGPKAKEMTLWKPEKRIEEALVTLSKFSKCSVDFLRDQILEIHTHDWCNDPYARGAYSFVETGGVEAAQLLEKPFKKKLFFAGEATISGPARGTVHGAIQSGRRAANDIIKTLETKASDEPRKTSKSRPLHPTLHS